METCDPRTVSAMMSGVSNQSPPKSQESKKKKTNVLSGWTSKDGREIAMIGQRDSTAFVEVMKDGSLVFLANLPTATGVDIWRDIKTIGDYAYIVADVQDHGMQILDMNKVLAIDPKSPKTFSQSDLTAYYKGWGRCHNLAASEKTNMVYCGLPRGGTDNCNGHLGPMDVSDPANPKGMGCIKHGLRVHDAQCTTYDGPDAKYKGKEICLDFDEKQFTIVDMSDKRNGKEIAKKTYNGLRYTHQGWWTDKTQRFILLGDELDEGKSDVAKDGHTRTFIIDAKDLANPVFTGVYRSPARAIDHNLFTIDGIAYMANYNAGLRVVDATSLESDPTGKGLKEIAYFDVYPEDDGGKGKLDFVGAWGVYPYFKSGYIMVSSMERGLFSLKMQ